MRIKTAYLEGHLGLLEGTGRGEVSLDLEPAHTAGLRRIFFFGRNGSGKSATVNSLHPFPDGYLLVPGQAGRKEIVLVRPDGVEVTCDLRWNSRGRGSFFLRISGELVRETAKGTLGEYLAAVRDHLGVTPAYLRIGQVGSSVSGFLDMLPTARKAYIGQFMPEVAEWAAAHRNASRRLQLMTQQLSGMQVELQRIEPREELEASTARTEAECARFRDGIRALDTRLGVAAGTLAELSPAREGILTRAGATPAVVFNPIPNFALGARLASERAAHAGAALIVARPSLARFSERAACEERITALRQTLARAEGVSEATSEARRAGRARLDSALEAHRMAQADLDRAASSGDQLRRLGEQEAGLVAELETARAAAVALPKAPVSVAYDDVKASCDVLGELEAELAGVRAEFPTSDLLDLAVRAGLDESAMAGELSRARGVRTEAAARLDTLRARVTTTEAQVSFHRRFDGMHCTDPRCPFEHYVSQFAPAAGELEEKKGDIAVREGQLVDQDERIRQLAALGPAVRRAAALRARLRQRRPSLVAAGLWDRVGPDAAFLALLTSTGTASAEVLSARRLLETVGAARAVSEAERLLSQLRERVEHLRALTALRDQLEEAVRRAVEVETIARSEFDVLEGKVQDALRQVDSQQQAIILLTELLRHQQDAETNAMNAATLEALSAELEALRGRWEAAEAEKVEAEVARAEVDAALAEAASTLSSARLRLGRRDEYEARLAELSGKISQAQLISDSCHPARGAPVEFIRDFLEVTRESVNGLLDVALQGEFRIFFSLTDTEFRIPVAKGSGRVIPDVTEASAGQLALAKTVISLALVKQTLLGAGAYNVVTLDEIDGPLDRERNRERFAEIVDRLVADLGVEQLLVISHNDNFHAAPAGLVLLPGHALNLNDPSFMSNKVVLADLS